jgi:hypothetical protein
MPSRQLSGQSIVTIPGAEAPDSLSLPARRDSGDFKAQFKLRVGKKQSAH